MAAGGRAMPPEARMKVQDNEPKRPNHHVSRLLSSSFHQRPCLRPSVGRIGKVVLFFRFRLLQVEGATSHPYREKDKVEGHPPMHHAGRKSVFL